MNQSTLDNALSAVVALKGRIAFPDGRYLGECTAPIAWYMQYLGAPLPAMYNARADGWGLSFPPSLAPFFSLEAFQSGKAYPKGTILMWNSPHIAILPSGSSGGSTVQVFEQNADPDGAGCETTTRVLNNAYHTCTYAMIPKIAVATAPAPAPQGGDEMIATQDQAVKIYKMLRPNGNPSQDEINQTVGRRTFAGFLNDAQGEVNARDSNLRDQQTQLANMQTSLDNLNAQIVSLTTQDNVDKEQLSAALAKVATLTAQIESTHSNLTALSAASTAPTQPAKPKTSLLTQAILFALKFKKK